jgi:hypothetical protein
MVKSTQHPPHFDNFLSEMATPVLYSDKSADAEKGYPQYIGEDDSDKVSDLNRLPRTITKVTTLGDGAGTVHNYTASGNTILLPTPSDDPNDPLNWSKAYKWYITCLVAMAVFTCNLTAAGPSIAILQTSMT